MTTGRVARVVAQAKVNLHLRVLDRQPDGYHFIITQFQRLALGDTVTVREASAMSLDVHWADARDTRDLGPVEQNLAWRAAAAYGEAAGHAAPVAIEIVKRIPVGGGLGGGSADAAAVLRALDALAPAPLAPAALHNVVRALGADVAFLASPHERAAAWGRGDELHGLPALPRAAVLLVVPPFGVNTAEAYRALARPAGSWAALGVDARTDAPDDWDATAALAANDFEPVVFARHPELGEVRRTLGALPGARFAMMSGSGSTLFAVLRDGAATTVAVPEGWRVVRTETAAVAGVELT